MFVTQLNQANVVMEFIIASNSTANLTMNVNRQINLTEVKINALQIINFKNQSLKHTLSELFLIDRMDCSYISYSSCFGSGWIRLGNIL